MRVVWRRVPRGERIDDVSGDLPFDEVAIARVCEQFGVARLSAFGSVLRDDFDSETSDVDFLVEYKPDADLTFSSYLALRAELETIVGRPVDLVDVRTLRNPYFTRNALSTSREVYAA